MPPACTVEVRLKPNARQNTVELGDNGILQVRVNAPPIDGRANTALIELLSEILDIPKSHLSIKRGAASKNKVVSVLGMTKEEIMKRLAGR
jgi:uncharacterized protein